MAEQTEVEWPTCEQAGCIGIRLASARMCLAHVGEEETAAALKLVSETGAIDARGVPITRALLERILTAAPRGENAEPVIKGCQFGGATFTDAKFVGATFNRFDRVTFSGDAGFVGATFAGNADFTKATFAGNADFTGSTFTGDAGFVLAEFKRSARFDRVTFTGSADFSGATAYVAWFVGATFTGDADFVGATFTGSGDFSGATFTGDAVFAQVTFGDKSTFASARFEQARYFGPLLAYRELILDEVQFEQPVLIQISSTDVYCLRARFPGGVQFRLRWARVVLDDTDLAAPSILAGIPLPPGAGPGRREEEEQIGRTLRQELAPEIAPSIPAGIPLLPCEERTLQQELAREISERPQLFSLQRANVAGLGLSNVSAAHCRFAGAHNLDKLRLESDVSFAAAPSPLSSGGRRWAGREVIAEERDWRANRSRWSSRHWDPPGWPHWLDGRPDVLDPGQIAGLYRALRKGREDIKDEPGAADFYYGEMEMRRARPLRDSNPGGQSAAASRGRVERGILTAYWLVSGYGLRAWRAVVALAAVTALLAVAFHLAGFAVPPRPVSYWTSLLYAFRATLSLTDDQVRLTAWGQLLQGVLRLTGPVLLGLALLALRGRVKR